MTIAIEKLKMTGFRGDEESISKGKVSAIIGIPLNGVYRLEKYANGIMALINLTGKTTSTISNIVPQDFALRLIADNVSYEVEVEEGQSSVYIPFSNPSNIQNVHVDLEKSTATAECSDSPDRSGNITLTNCTAGTLVLVCDNVSCAEVDDTDPETTFVETGLSKDHSLTLDPGVMNVSIVCRVKDVQGLSANKSVTTITGTVPHL